MFTEIVRPQLNKISGLLGVIASRQQMTSNNIANLHTPNFSPRHASFDELLGQTSNQFETRLAQKMGGGSLSALLGEDETPQGVVLQDEMMDMQKNLLYYSIATRRLSSLLNALRTAGQVGR
jgi:flagellar basal-body rod protein FlgB